MPTYETICTQCGVKADRRLSFSAFDKIRAGTQELQCSGCEAKVEFSFSPGTLGFILKEGPSGGWATKSIKENQYRKKRGTVMSQRQKDHVRTPKLQPNYKGEETGTWKEAQEAVRKEKGDLAASTYAPLVSIEKSS
jgi:hypothetical protein